MLGKGAGSGDKDDDEGAASKAAKKGKGGKGRGRGRGRVMKRPAAKPAKPEPVGEEAEEEEHESDEEIPAEGAASASSNQPPEQPPQLRRATPLVDPAQGKGKGRGGRGGKGKGKKGDAEAAGPPQAPPFGLDAAWEQSVKCAVRQCLEECQAAGELHKTCEHTHRDVTAFDSNSQFSVYWSRHAVGVKTRENPTQKWAQVAYFARPSPCILTNVVIAEQWV